MGRKNAAKGKEKRMQRKEEQMRISVAKSVVDAANKLEDPMAPFPVFRNFNKNGIDANLYVKKVVELNEDTKSWIFKLTKRNMQLKYEQCSWGWNDTKKYEEMMDDEAWYLIAQAKDGTLLGFSHFRFDLDYGLEVLYCYELQLESPVHRKGLGKFMMQILELIAFTNNMKKVILTVLKNNQYSNFFKALNYTADETSPHDEDDEEYCYEILSKINKKFSHELAQSHGHSHHHHHGCC